VDRLAGDDLVDPGMVVLSEKFDWHSLKAKAYRSYWGSTLCSGWLSRQTGTAL
jgi:hypothetical protein